LNRPPIAIYPQITQIDADHRIEPGGVTLLTGRAGTTYRTGFSPQRRKGRKEDVADVMRQCRGLTVELAAI